MGRNRTASIRERLGLADSSPPRTVGGRELRWLKRRLYPTPAATREDAEHIIRRDRQRGLSFEDIAERHGVMRETVRRICDGD
ncbi:MAG: hypothetical protein KDG55_08780 [Rhodocyclaceae bacterium]|nr:hypothetical protein [Rhodocyclaceae bacterium]